MVPAGWKERACRLPLLGGVLEMARSIRDVYDVVGWTDPGYHRVRSAQERLDEARKIAAIGSKPENPPVPEESGSLPAGRADEQDPRKGDAAAHDR